MIPIRKIISKGEQFNNMPLNAASTKTNLWIQTLRLFADIAKECDADCPLLHRLQSTSLNIKHLDKKERFINSILQSSVRILKKEEGWRKYIYDDYNGHKLKKGQTIKGNPTAMYGMTEFLNDTIPFKLYQMYPCWGDLGVALHVNKIINFDLLKFAKYLPHLNEARTTVIICMIYQMGTRSVLSFTKTLKGILNDDWIIVKKEMLDSVWAKKQTPRRAKRMSNIMKRGTL